MIKETRAIVKALCDKWQVNDEKCGSKKNILIIFLILFVVSIGLLFPFFHAPQFSFPAIVSLYSSVSIFSFALFFLVYLLFVHNHFPQFTKYIFYMVMLMLIAIDIPLFIIYILLQIFCKVTIKSFDLFEISITLLGIDTILSIIIVFSAIYFLTDKIDIALEFLQENSTIKVSALFYLLLLLSIFGLTELINYIALKFIIKRLNNEEKSIRSFVRFILLFILVFIFSMASVTKVFGNDQSDIINVITIFTLFILLADKRKTIVLDTEKNSSEDKKDDVLLSIEKRNEENNNEKSVELAKEEKVFIREKTSYSFRKGRIIEIKRKIISKKN